MQTYKYINSSKRGVLITYPCGTTRFIANSWYIDIDINQL